MPPSNVHPFPRRPTLHVVQQANAYGFAPLIDQDGTRVLINGCPFHTFMGETGATRVAAALQTLAEYGLIDRVRT